MYSDNPCLFNTNNTEHGDGEFIKISELYNKNENNNLALVEDNKVVIGVFIRTYRYDNENFVKEIKDLNSQNNHYDKNEIMNENVYEWRIDNYDRIKNNKIISCPEFKIGDYRWNLKLYPNGLNSSVSDHISINLTNLTLADMANNKNANKKKSKNKNKSDLNVYTNVLFFVRNKNNYYYHTIKCYDGLQIFNKYTNYFYDKEFCEKKELYVKNEDDCISLIEDNKIIFGVYICIYKPNTYDKFVNRMKRLINDSKLKYTLLDERFFEQEVENWKEDCEKYFFSNEIIAAGLPWEIEIEPNDKGYLSFGLYCNEFKNKYSSNRNASIYLQFVMYIRNYKDFNITLTHATNSVVSCEKDSNGFNIKNFIEYVNLYNEKKRLYEDDTLVYGVYLRVYKKKPEIKIVNKDISVQYQSDDKTDGGGIIFHYDEDGDLDVKLYTYKLNVKTGSIEYSKFSIEKLNTDYPKLKDDIDQGKITIQQVLQEAEPVKDEDEDADVDIAIATRNHKARASYEMSLNKNDIILIVNWNYDDEMAMGFKRSSQHKSDLALVPKNCIKKYDKKTHEQKIYNTLFGESSDEESSKPEKN